MTNLRGNLTKCRSQGHLIACLLTAVCCERPEFVGEEDEEVLSNLQLGQRKRPPKLWMNYISSFMCAIDMELNILCYLMINSLFFFNPLIQTIACSEVHPSYFMHRVVSLWVLPPPGPTVSEFQPLVFRGHFGEANIAIFLWLSHVVNSSDVSNLFDPCPYLEDHPT